MALIYCGIDEAGYGPLLGPLCVARAVFRVESWVEGVRHRTCGRCWTPRFVDRRVMSGRVAVDDSKKLKLASSSVRKHPLTHLERRVLTFLACAENQDADAPAMDASGGLVRSDAAFFERAGVALPAQEWYYGPSIDWPLGTSAEALGIASSMLRLALDRAGVSVVGLACEAIGEVEFNELVEAGGSKAAATEAALVKHLWDIWNRFAPVDAVLSGESDASSGGDGGVSGVRVVCDRQGGRARYSEFLQRVFPTAEIIVTHETQTQSRYEVVGPQGASPDGRARHMHVLFMVESETHHLPVALASMLAKLTRESMMARFNRFWRQRMPELKPTAGYRQDGWRWLGDAGDLVTKAEREIMIRRA